MGDIAWGDHVNTLTFPHRVSGNRGSLWEGRCSDDVMLKSTLSKFVHKAITYVKCSLSDIGLNTIASHVYKVNTMASEDKSPNRYHIRNCNIYLSI